MEPSDLELARRRAFGRRVRAIREERALAQEEVAQRAGCTLKQFREIELGNRAVRLDGIWDLARALECTPVEFFEAEPPAVG